MFKRTTALQVWILCLWTCSASCKRIPDTQNLTITGIEDSAFSKQFLQAAKDSMKTPWNVSSSSKDPFVHIACLKEQCLDYLYSLGYLSAHVEVEHQKQKKKTQIQVYLGPKYIFETLIVYENGILIVPEQEKIPRAPQGQVAETAVLEAYYHVLKTYYRDHGYPQADISDTSFTVDAHHARVEGHIEVTTGPKAYFGKIHLLNLQNCAPQFVLQHFSFNEGDLYQHCLVFQAQEQLTATGLFEKITIELGEESAIDQTVPLYITLFEIPLKTVSLGISWNFTHGLGCTADWGHENLFGHHERVYFSSTCTLSQQSASLSFIGPHLKHFSAFPLFETNVSRSAKEAVNEYSHAIEWSLFLTNSGLIHKFGIKWEQFYDEFLGKTQLASFPVELYLPLTSQVQPTKPTYLFCSCIIQPFAKLFPSLQHFLNISTKTKLQIPLTEICSMGIRIYTQTVFGLERSQLPKELRCFGGSPDVLRGYAAKSVSSLNEKKLPVGGLSMIGVSFQPRIQLIEGLDLLLFCDLGQVYNTSRPRFEEGFLYSLGLGICQNSYLGNLHIEIGVPMQPRQGIDNRFEVYLFLGERF